MVCKRANDYVLCAIAGMWAACDRGECLSFCHWFGRPCARTAASRRHIMVEGVFGSHRR